jgi:glycosyltransferase involved in cell wall biosynthesis
VVYIPHSQTTIGYLKDSPMIIIARLLGRRVVGHLRGGNWRNWLGGASWATRAYVRLVHGMVDGQIVLGETLRGLFSDVLPPERIFVVPNGKDIAYPPRPPADDRVRVVYLGNMIRTKGVLDVLHAVPSVAARCRNAEFQFAGAWDSPDVRREVEEFLAANPGLPIRWLGATHGAQKLDLRNRADVFVYPTYYPPEGHPWVIVEAMAAGLPIVSTDQGAIVESVMDGRNGFIVPKRSPAVVAERITQLVEDAALRARMGAESRRLYEAEFTEARMVARLGDALAAVVARR